MAHNRATPRISSQVGDSNQDLRALSRAEREAVGAELLRQTKASDAGVYTFAAPVALALVGDDYPADAGARLALVLTWPFLDVLECYDRVMALSRAAEGDS